MSHLNYSLYSTATLRDIVTEVQAEIATREAEEARQETARIEQAKALLESKGFEVRARAPGGRP